MPFSVDTKTDVNQIKLTHNLNAAYFVNLKPPSSGSGYSLTFPSSTGSSGQSLTSDGNGSLSWTTISASGNLTDVQSLLNTSLIIGRDNDNKIDFSTDNTIQLITNGDTSNPVTINSDNRILNIATPTGTNDAANKNYVDNLAQGIFIRESCRVATTGNISLTNEQTIDGISVVAGDRVLVKDQTDTTQNGIYLCVNGGSWTRASDFDDNPDNSEIKTGMYYFISLGSTNASKSFVLSEIGGTTEPTITLGTTTFTFTQFSGHGSSLATNGGLVVSDTNQLSLSLNNLTAATVNVANDSIAIIDADDSNNNKKESIADLVTAMAGVGIGASSGVLSLDLNELSSAAVSVANDSIAIIDADDSNNNKKESIADLVTAMAGDGIGASSGVLAINVDDSSIEINSDTLRVKSSGITNSMLAGSIDLTSKVTGTLPVANGGTGLSSLGSASAGQVLKVNSGANGLEFGNVGDITAVTAGDGLSGGGTSGGVSLALDLNELSSAEIQVSMDSFAFIDVSGANSTRKERISDLITAIAGSGLSATAGVLSFDVGSTTLTTSTVNTTNDKVIVWDYSASAFRKADLIAVCFLKGTKITMSDYSQKSIEDLSLEDNVLTYKINELDDIRKKTEIIKWNKEIITGKFSQSGIRNIWINPTDSYLVINNILKVTPGHIMFYKRENKYYLSHAIKLEIGDELMNSKGEYDKITDILHIKEKINVYNFEVDNDSTYFAEDYLVHHMCELCSGYSKIL